MAHNNGCGPFLFLFQEIFLKQAGKARRQDFNISKFRDFEVSKNQDFEFSRNQGIALSPYRPIAYSSDVL